MCGIIYCNFNQIMYRGYMFLFDMVIIQCNCNTSIAPRSLQIEAPRRNKQNHYA